MGTPKLNQKELNKFIEVLGVQEVKYLFCYDKIKLTSQQLDYLCNYGKDDGNGNTNKQHNSDKTSDRKNIRLLQRKTDNKKSRLY